jgi:hypothetical protein
MLSLKLRQDPANSAWLRPQWTVREGVRELYDAYSSNGLTAADLKSGGYLRINSIRRLSIAEIWTVIFVGLQPLPTNKVTASDLN